MKNSLTGRILLATFAFCSLFMTAQASNLCRPDVQAAIGELQKISGSLSSIETAIVVQDDGTLRRFQGVKDKAPFEYDVHSLLVLHNHPYNDVEPSAHDRGVAKQIGIPVYVVTRTQVWVAMPDGSIHVAGSFQTLTLFTADPEGPPLYGRQHFFTESNVLSECVDTRLSATVFLKSAK